MIRQSRINKKCRKCNDRIWSGVLHHDLGRGQAMHLECKRKKTVIEKVKAWFSE